MTPTVRAVLRVLLFGALCVAVPNLPAEASTADLEFKDCACEEIGGGACQHFLRNPSGATDDPCWCDKCRNGSTGEHHDGNRIPGGWAQTTFQTGGMEHYLKRHSLAWGITCSECFANTKSWPDGSGGNLGTVPETDFGGLPAKETITKRLAAEKELFKKPDGVILAYNRHFYICTDIEGLKVRMPGGSSRLISKHEWIHLMIERGEFARREWVRNLGEPMTGRPVAVWMPEKSRDKDKISGVYFRSPGSDGLRGNGSELCDKMCMTGIAFSQDRTGDDVELQVMFRHMLAHNLLSLWGSYEIRPKANPIWMVEGLAHWLTKSTERLKDEATYCVSEGSSQSGGGAAAGRGAGGGGGKPSWSEKNWDKEVARLAATTGKLGPIEVLLAKSTAKELEEDDQRRSWSYIDLCLSEWREPFVKVLLAIRQEKDLREAFMSNLGCTPEIFDERWRERVTGKRKSMAPQPNEAEPEANDTPGARDRRAIRGEQDPIALAAKVRGLGEVADKKTIPVVVDVLSRNNDLVRETALVTLLKTKDTDCLSEMWKYGLSHSDGIVRAYTAKVCARLALEDAVDKLREQLEDKNWYARAEAAVACGTMKNTRSMPGLRKMISNDPSDKAQIAAIDAFAMFGEDGATGAPLISTKLDSSQWQIRIAAAQALGKLGSMDAVDGLITRMEKETGRLADELYDALKAISRDDLGRNPQNWRTWWEREKANAPDGRPKRPEEKKPDEKPKFDPNDPRSTSAKAPPYFGVEIYSNRVGFVFDTSESMLTLFSPDPSAAKALSREYVGRDKLTICKEEIAQALSKLDPRSHFNIVSFGKQVRSFKQNPVPASPGNIDSAVGFMKSLPGEGETNYYDALKLALDIGDQPDTNADLKSTPDTITFLTDGTPTKGDIVDADTLLEWYTGLNRYARVKTHTITFGLLGVDMPLLREMAARNGGRFTIVPELPQKSR